MRIDYFRIQDIARRTGIPVESVRIYAALFDDFLTYATEGDEKLYTPDVLFIMKRISEIFASGKNADQVRERLNEELPQLLEQRTAPIKDTECPEDICE